MNLHEYQAKELLRHYDLPLLHGVACFSVADVEKAAESLTTAVFAVKSQIHAGGRGAGHFKDNPSGKGGVRIVKSPAEAVSDATQMLGNILVTKQTGEEGKKVERIIY